VPRIFLDDDVPQPGASGADEYSDRSRLGFFIFLIIIGLLAPDHINAKKSAQALSPNVRGTNPQLVELGDAPTHIGTRHRSIHLFG
jgi:hypothetical protein